MSEERGAERMLRAAQALGVRACFANPGTTELTIVRALETAPRIRPILGLAEGVCTGAADGYARVSGEVATTLLHLGPGLANGIANLHNARRAASPIVNIVGDHASWHLPYDAPLTSDIESLARPVSRAVIRMRDAETAEADVRTAIENSREAPGGVVTLIAPTDVMDAPVRAAPAPDRAPPQSSPRGVGAARVKACADTLGDGPPLILLLGTDALCERGQRAAERIAAATGARLLMETYPAIVPLGGGLPRLERLAYFPEDVLRQLGRARVVLVGARAPVSYFGYEGQPSPLVPDDRLTLLSQPDEDGVGALEELAELVAPRNEAARQAPEVHAPIAADKTLSPQTIIAAVIEQLPANAIVSIEGSTLGGVFLQQAHRARRHRAMTNTGGAIGQGLPCAVGAAVAAPDAKVVALQSDGSAQYTLQALWTMAHERLNVVVVIAANHRYAILQTELKRAGANIDEAAIAAMTKLDRPQIDWVALSNGYGVEAVRAASPAEFQTAFRAAIGARGPFLIEAALT